MSEHEAPAIAWPWEEERSIGGHGSAAIACMHPHLKPIDVYRRLVDGEEREQTPEMEWGLWIEPMLLEWAARKLLMGDMQPAGIARSTKYPWLHSAPDARFAGNEQAISGLVSAKHVGGFRSRFWGTSKTDRVPNYANIQEQLYMGLLDEPVSYVVAAIGGKAPELWAVPFDSSAFDAIVELDESFMRRHVIPRIPPPPDGSPAYKRWISEKVEMRHAELLAVAEHDEIRSVVEDYRRARLASDEAAKTLELQDQRLRTAIGDNGGIELVDTKEKITCFATKKIAKNGKPVRQLRVPNTFKLSTEEE